MKLFSLSKIEQFSPGDQEFLLTSVKLLKEELQIFKEELDKHRSVSTLPELRNAIHRIKSNIELFLFVSEFQEVLMFVYELNKDFTDEFKLTVALNQIDTFTRQILDEVEAYINSNQ